MFAAGFSSRVSQSALILALAFNTLSWHAEQAWAATPAEIDTEHSTLTVRVYKSGLFSAFAHDHEIHAPIRQGSFDENQQAVEFTVNAPDLRVMDPGVSQSERSQIQSTMLGPKVLDSEKFQEIRFRSTKIEQAGAGKWNVQGDLTLHGQTHAVTVKVEGEHGHYRGSAVLKQTDFGMTPIRIGGGSIKVKDEVRVEFEILGKRASVSQGEFGSPRLSWIQRFS